MIRRTTTAGAALAAAALTAAALAPAAHAAGPAAPAAAAARAAVALKPMVGLTTVDLQGAVAQAFKKQHVTIAGSAPASVTAAGRVLLPVGSGVVAKDTTLGQTGTLTLRRKAAGKSRSVVLRSLRLELDAKPALSAVIGGKRVDFLSLDLRRNEYTAIAAASSVQVVTTRASLTAAAAKVIGTGLAIPSLRPGLLGVLGSAAGVVVNAAATTATTTDPVTGVKTTVTTTPTTTTTTVTAPDGTSTTTTAPTTTAPATTVPGATTAVTPMARPASAQTVTPGPLNWHIRESLIRYLNNGAPIEAAAGATLGAPQSIGGAPPLIYDGIYVPATGWVDAASGRASLQYTGTIHLSYPGHGIDITVSNPQVELSGTDSRVIAVYGGSSATAYAGLGVLAAVDPKGATLTDDGATATYATAPGTVPSSSASSVFAGFYSAGDQFGNFSFSYTRGS